jgi:hypothetical protein
MRMMHMDRLHRDVRALLLAVHGLLMCSPGFAQPNPASVAPDPKPIADQRTTRMLVLDASGSMWNNVGDKLAPLRAQLAAKFVEMFTAQLAGESTPRNLGMVRLGYLYDWKDRTNRDKLCNDVEVVVKPGSASQVRDKIAYESGVGRNVSSEDYNPKGYTPLTLAIEQAANAAPPEGATLVVVTDLDAQDKNCVPDPCADNGRPIPSLEALLRERHIRIRYVIAAGLIGSIGERARRFATCFGAEYRLLDGLDQAGKLGIEVGLNLIREVPQPAVAAPVHRGTILVELQNANGQKMDAPPGSQLEVRRPRATAPLMRLPGEEIADPGHYESSLSVGDRRWKVADVEVSADRKTDIAYVIADGILRMSLVDTDFRPIDNEFNTVWEISSTPGPATQPVLRVKGPRMSQALPAGRYHISIFTSTAVVPKDVTIEAGQELNVTIPLPQP